MPFGPKAPICSKPLNATICDPDQRTVNTRAPCGSDEDYFFYSPWRRPGSAPVIDSCGTAGGRIPGQGSGGFGAAFVNTTHAKIGDLGSKLPHTPSGVTWKAGDTVEVAWTLQANHGGGYSYRLCPLSSTLNEHCFKQTPLDFEGPSMLRWGGRGGRKQYFNATTVSQGTDPPGSTWRRNPIPRTWKDEHGNWGKGSNQFQTGYGFKPYCIDQGQDRVGNQYSCTGEWGPYNLEIVDQVRIPASLPAGAYVLGFRWDCEESNQIWASCSDIDIISDVTPKPVNECGGVFGNNEGGRDPPPVAAGSACKCSALCQANSSCAGWTYSKSEFKKGDRDCYLRDSWGAMANNCNDCYSAPRNHSAV